jgi:carboxylesterase type B
MFLHDPSQSHICSKRSISNLKKKTHTYCFIGVPHGWDLFYVFGAPLVGHPKHNYTARDIEVAKTTMTIFSNYVKYGQVLILTRLI